MNTIYRNGNNYSSIHNKSRFFLYNNIHFIKDNKFNKNSKLQKLTKEGGKIKMNEMKGEKGKNMRNKGITLIALVITIVLNAGAWS